MDNLTKTVARAICKASGRCKYIGPKCNTGRCDVSPEQAQAAIRAVLDGIREPDEAMVREGIDWNTTPEKWRAMIDELRNRYDRHENQRRASCAERDVSNDSISKILGPRN